MYLLYTRSIATCLSKPYRDKNRGENKKTARCITPGLVRRVITKTKTTIFIFVAV
jgi:hypothetical protein